MLTSMLLLFNTSPLAFFRSLTLKRTCRRVSVDHTSTTAFNLSPFHPVPVQDLVSLCSTGTSLLKYNSSVEPKETCMPADWLFHASLLTVVSDVYSPL